MSTILSVKSLKHRGFRKLSISQSCFFKKHQRIYLILLQTSKNYPYKVKTFITESDPSKCNDIVSLQEFLRYSLYYDDNDINLESLDKMLSLNTRDFIEFLQKRIVIDILVLQKRSEQLNNNFNKLTKILEQDLGEIIKEKQ